MSNPEPKMTKNGSPIQLHLDFMNWLLWAKLKSPCPTDKIMKEAERRARLCGIDLDELIDLGGFDLDEN